ncbi:MAG TPA: ParB-like protein [Rhizomicrobium sp.]|jgi:hypothetical protein|nr:ParB-like protein [Rhizomicrobium sp.]
MTSKDYAGSAREPILKPVPLKALRPTQITVGMREVEARRKHWKSETTKAKRAKFLQKHLIPVILGPDGEHYILDHHHLALALHQEGLREMYVTVVADLCRLDMGTFWFVMDNRDWMHPFDHKGVRQPHTAIPRTIDGLVDDPFRSLAGELRRAGGFAKDTVLYSEFLWADFLRRRMKAKAVTRDFPRALRRALELAKSRDANYLPGWCGPVEL